MASIQPAAEKLTHRVTLLFEALLFYWYPAPKLLASSVGQDSPKQTEALSLREARGDSRTQETLRTEGKANPVLNIQTSPQHNFQCVYLSVLQSFLSSRD